MKNFSGNFKTQTHASNLFVAVFVMTIFGLVFTAVQTSKQNKINLQRNNQEEFEFVQEDVINDPNLVQDCKSGLNTALATTSFTPEWIEASKAHSMKYIVSIMYSGGENEIEQAKNLINQAGENDIIPIFRICDAGSSCTVFQSPQYLISLINRLKEGTNGNRFVFIAGPNEPISERWMIQGIDEYSGIFDQNINEIGTDSDLFKKYFRLLAEYSNTIGQAFLNDEQVIISGPVFNFDYASLNHIYLQEYIQYLDTTKVGSISGNLYDITNTQGLLVRKASDVYSSIQGLIQTKGLQVYILEFGAYSENKTNPLKDNLKLSYQQLAARDEILAINFFNPFLQNPDSNFLQHSLDSAQIGDISGCDVDENYVPETTVQTGTDIQMQKIFVPYAKYYQERYKNWEIESCDVSKQAENVNSSFQIELKPSQSDPNTFEGGYIMSAKVENFPELNHYGSTTAKIGDHEQEFGTSNSPYIPICNIIASFFSSNNAIVTREHPGLLNLYSKNDKSEIAVPKLGSGIGCLNLLSVGFNSPEIIEGRTVADDYKGFDIMILDSEEYQEAWSRGINTLEKKEMRKKGYTEDFIENLKAKFEEFMNVVTNQYKRDRLINEPIVDYEEVEYCKEGPLKIRFLDKLASNPSESVSSNEQIALVKKYSINFQNDVCNNFDNLKNQGYVISMNSTQITSAQEICQQTTIPDNISIFRQIQISNDDIPHKIGIPGGMSAFGKLFEYTQTKTLSNHRLIAGQNGIEISMSYNFYDIQGKPIAMFESENIEFDHDTFQTVKLESRSFQDIGQKKISARVSYIVPINFSPMLRALAYNYNGSFQSNEYFIENNQHIRNYFSRQGEDQP